MRSMAIMAALSLRTRLGATASVHATRAVQRHGLLRLENTGRLSSMRNPRHVDGAQSLDGGPSDGEPALSPNGQKLGPNTAARKCSVRRPARRKQFHFAS